MGFGEYWQVMSRHKFRDMVMNFGDGDISSSLALVSLHIDAKVVHNNCLFNMCLVNI